MWYLLNRRRFCCYISTKTNNNRIITYPRRRRSEQAFLLFPEKPRKGSHFPWVRTNYEVPFNPWSTLWLFILSSLCIDCLHFNPSCTIRSLILLGLVLEMGSFSVTGKRSFFVFDDSVCFYQNHMLSNTGIDFMNNFQLVKYSFETVLFPNFRSFQNFSFWGKWRSLNVSSFSIVPV